jgi:hypothetical protein
MATEATKSDIDPKLQSKIIGRRFLRLLDEVAIPKTVGRNERIKPSVAIKKMLLPRPGSTPKK